MFTPFPQEGGNKVSNKELITTAPNQPKMTEGLSRHFLSSQGALVINAQMNFGEKKKEKKISSVRHSRNKKGVKFCIGLPNFLSMCIIFPYRFFSLPFTVTTC